MLNQIFFRTTFSTCVTAVTFLTSIQSSLALSTNTTFSNLDGLSNSIDEVVFHWSTNLTSGTVTPENLNEWTIVLKSSGSEIFRDDVIIGSSVQPIGGVTRSLSDLSFNYDFASNNLNFWDNDNTSVQFGSIGTTYDVSGSDNVFGITFDLREFNNGSPGSVTSDADFSQSTIIPTAVPFEFSPSLGLILMAGAFGICRHIRA